MVGINLMNWFYTVGLTHGLWWRITASHKNALIQWA